MGVCSIEEGSRVALGLRATEWDRLDKPPRVKPHIRRVYALYWSKWLYRCAVGDGVAGIAATPALAYAQWRCHTKPGARVPPPEWATYAQ